MTEEEYVKLRNGLLNSAKLKSKAISFKNEEEPPKEIVKIISELQQNLTLLDTKWNQQKRLQGE